MKINPISFTQNIPQKSAKTHKKTLTLSDNEIIKPLPDGGKLVLRDVNNADSDNYNVRYFGVLDKNDHLLKDAIFDKRYNEIRAIEYQKTSGGFNYIQNSLSISFDEKGKIRNVYLISHDKNNTVHSSLNIKHGFDVSIHHYNKNEHVFIDKEDKNSLLKYFLHYSTKVLSEIEENKLIGSENLSEKFNEFSRLTV